MKHILISLEKYRSLMQRACPEQVSSSTVSEQTSPPTVPEIEVPIIDETIEDTPSEGLSIEHILAIIPKRAQNKANSLLHLLQPHLKWTKRGEIVIHDRPIANSHIADLVKYTVMRHIHKRLPTGGTEYIAILASINTPRSLIVNEQVIELLTQPTPTPSAWHSL